MTTRILPRDEWPRLAGTLLERAWPHFEGQATVVVVERDGAIVGCAAVFQAWHLEGAWIAPEHRGRVGVGRRLIAGMRAAIRATGARELLTMVCDPDTRRLHTPFGESVRLDGEHYAVQVKG